MTGLARPNSIFSRAASIVQLASLVLPRSALFIAKLLRYAHTHRPFAGLLAMTPEELSALVAVLCVESDPVTHGSSL